MTYLPNTRRLSRQTPRAESARGAVRITMLRWWRLSPAAVQRGALASRAMQGSLRCLLCFRLRHLGRRPAASPLPIGVGPVHTVRP